MLSSFDRNWVEVINFLNFNNFSCRFSIRHKVFSLHTHTHTHRFYTSYTSTHRFPSDHQERGFFTGIKSVILQKSGYRKYFPCHSHVISVKFLGIWTAPTGGMNRIRHATTPVCIAVVFETVEPLNCRTSGFVIVFRCQRHVVSSISTLRSTTYRWNRRLRVKPERMWQLSRCRRRVFETLENAITSGLTARIRRLCRSEANSRVLI